MHESHSSMTSTCTKYTRNTLAGMGSHILVATEVMRRYPPRGKAYIDINLSNYGIDTKWDMFFDQDSGECEFNIDLIKAYMESPCHNKSEYTEHEIAELHRTYNKHIKLNKSITRKINEIDDRFGISSASCLYFRGTDKEKEASRVDFSVYKNYIPRQGPVWVQSDEKNFVDYIHSLIPHRAYSIDEFNYSKEGKPIHKSATAHDAFEILVIMGLMARAKSITSNISNVSHVSLIMRGSCNGYYCVQ
ncbi:hypothetical protein [Xanthobacter sediminis]